jgi:hypothetical protein
MPWLGEVPDEKNIAASVPRAGKPRFCESMSLKMANLMKNREEERHTFPVDMVVNDKKRHHRRSFVCHGNELDQGIERPGKRQASLNSSQLLFP